ncbi:MAG: type IX secretion system sortase PorU, partial [Ignavibacteria bacterium]
IINSVMSSGDWYRIEIRDNGDGKSDGIYKITKSFLESAGINLSNVDPGKIKMYGNGGDMLPVDFSSPRVTDLDEIPIYIRGDSDGHFDENDYILFYGRSVNNWALDSVFHKFNHYLNIYSGINYYWICLNTANYGKRMQVIPSDNNPGLVPSSFREMIFYEPELFNLNSEGNVWLGNGSSNGQSVYWNNTLAGLEDNTNILYKIKVASRVLDWYTNYMLLKEVNSSMSDFYFPLGTIAGGWGPWIWTGDTNFIINSSQKNNGELSSFRGTFFTNDPSGLDYLDWMEIQYSRRLNSVSGDFLRITDTNKNVTVQYNVSPFSGSQVRIFDASVHDSVKIISPLILSANNVRFQKMQSKDAKYFVVGPNGYKTPSGISPKFPNQNLHNITDGADFIIISYKDFIPAANRLKAKREAPGPGDPSYLKTIVVDVEQIYNEFSGGLLDPVAIRDFIKYSYDNWTRKPSFVCLLGDGSFDYKNIRVQTTDFIPPYEVCTPDIDQINSNAMDAFFVQLTPGHLRPDLAIGRIPAGSLDAANAYMDKLDCYEDGNYNGFWKNKFMFVADDGYTPNGNDGPEFTNQSEDIANLFTPKTIEPEKVYLIMYPAVITPQGRRKPAANADIIKNWNNGCTAVHYIGHGAPDVWANEYVFENNTTIPALNNSCRYPFVSVASCDFGKFDVPFSSCGAELLTISANKGSIGTLAATRPTLGESNAAFMCDFWDILYFNIDTLLLRNRFGTALFQALQVDTNANSLKFVLLGDPSVRTRIPRFRSRIDSIEGLADDTMRALSRIKIFGSVMHPDSSLWTDYSGKMYLKIFDADRYDTMYNEHNDMYHFILPGGIIFSGTQNIKNGLWTAEFIVPKDLSYQNKTGKLIDYFYNGGSDGSGIYTGFIVGGIDPDAGRDTTGPIINLFLNDRNFRSGDVVNENFSMLVDLFDESGINTTGTIGHKIEATFNDDINEKIDLTTYYNSDSTFKTGHISYPVTGFSPGRYKLNLKAWDTYNNSSIVELYFTVASSVSLQVLNIYNIPNPFKDNTVFTFQHNYPDPINAKIKIYTVAGRLIKEIDRYNISEKFVSIPWDGHDADGDRLSNGVYIYKLTVETGKGNSIVNTGKLAVLR